MANYYKPQEPLSMNGDYIYPLTTIDQVLSKDAQTRLDEDLIVKSTDVLSLEELEACTELDGKVLSAGASKELITYKDYTVNGAITINTKDWNYIEFNDSLMADYIPITGYFVPVAGIPQATYFVTGISKWDTWWRFNLFNGTAYNATIPVGTIYRIFYMRGK